MSKPKSKKRLTVTDFSKMKSKGEKITMLTAYDHATATMLDEAGEALPQTFGLGYALDIFAFEEWAKSHPTHLRIFDQFMQHAERFADQMQLRLWHEVSVIQEGCSEMQYIGCHPKTGLLPYL